MSSPIRCRWIQLNRDSKGEIIGWTRRYDDPPEDCVDVPKDSDDPALESGAYREARRALEAAGGTFTDLVVPIRVSPKPLSAAQSSSQFAPAVITSSDWDRAESTYERPSVKQINLQYLTLEGRRASMPQSDLIPPVNDHTTRKIIEALNNLEPVEFPLETIKLSPYLTTKLIQARSTQPDLEVFTISIRWYRPLDFYHYCYWQFTGFIAPIHNAEIPDGILFGVHVGDHQFLKSLVDVLFHKVDDGHQFMYQWAQLYQGKAGGRGLEERRDDNVLDVLVDAVVENASREAKDIIRGTKGHLFPWWLRRRFEPSTGDKTAIR